MKELSIEEKAKRYDEAIGVCRKLYNKTKANGYTALSEAYEQIFPELKKSEEENIRKDIIKAFKVFKEKQAWVGHCLDDIDWDACISWLEKQAEHANFCNKIQIGDKVTRNENGVLVNLSQLNRVAKPADKAEPKLFHEGEWIIFAGNHNSIYQVERIDNYRYYLRHYLGGTLSVHFDNKLIRKWTIQDAKDGDVLHCWIDGYEFVLIYKGIKDGYITTYGHLYQNLKSFSEEPTTMFCRTIQGHFTPATKEQRDTLFAKMKEAGYEWDAEKKELKKIHNALEECKIENIEYGKYYYCIKDYFAGGKKQASKGDVVQALRGLPIMALGVKANEYFLPINSIKQSHAWSEEDEAKLKSILFHIEDVENKDVIDWLKSLKERVQPQNTWKPSDEQIKGIECAIKTLQYQLNVGDKRLNSLYDDLKKLREDRLWS